VLSSLTETLGPDESVGGVTPIVELISGATSAVELESRGASSAVELNDGASTVEELRNGTTSGFEVEARAVDEGAVVDERTTSFGSDEEEDDLVEVPDDDA